MTMFKVTVAVEHEIPFGWGVNVTLLWDEDKTTEGGVSDIDVEIVAIMPSTVRVIGELPCVQLDGGGWVPTSLFLVNPSPAPDDHIELRSRWFETIAEATDYAAEVQNGWDHPNPWQPFVILD